MNNTREAISTFFTFKEVGNGISRLSHGAQFSNIGSVVGFFVTIVLLIIAVLAIINESYVIAVLILPLCVVLVAYLMDFQGIEIDSKQSKIRNYRSFLGIRLGTWRNLAEFKELVISQDSLLERRTLAASASYSSSRKYDTHRFYTLYLVDATRKNFIPLRQDDSVTRIRILAEKFSQFSQLSLHEQTVLKKSDVVGKWRVM